MYVVGPKLVEAVGEEAFNNTISNSSKAHMSVQSVKAFK